MSNQIENDPGLDEITAATIAAMKALKSPTLTCASDIGCTVSKKYDQYEVLFTRSVSSDGQDLSHIPLGKSTFNYEVNEGWEALKW